MLVKVVGKHALTAVRLATLAVLPVACGGGSDPIDPVTVTYDVSLAAGEFDLVNGTDVTGALSFPAAGASGAQYLFVGQLATTAADLASTFVIGSQATQASASFTEALGGMAVRQESPAVRFHHALRRREGMLAAKGLALGAAAARAPAVRTPPPVVGDQRTFRVCSDLECDVLKNVPATARFVGTHAAIFVDDSVPANGFSSGDLSQLGTQFDNVLYPINNARFGPESDIDGNGVVIVLLTKQINALIGEPQCDESFITGFFFGADIAPGFASQFNNGEVFYGMVPDPTGQVTCDYSVATVKRILQVTFIHEFQHMISFNQHVLVRSGPVETLWLNEAMSHLAEELGGLHYDSLGASADTSATRFHIGNFYNAGIWLADPEAVPVVTEEPPGSLESRGAGWLFVRWLVDQFGPNTSRQLVQTSQIGGAAVQQATGGTQFETLLGRWLLGLYVTDLPSFTAPASLAYNTWGLRARFQEYNQRFPADFPQAFPLVPAQSNGTGTAISGTINSGAGSYLLVTQPANASGFDLYFRRSQTALFSNAAAPQVAIVRIR